MRHYGFASPNAKQAIESVRWVVALHYQRTFLLLARQPHAGSSPPIRCPACGGPVAIVGFVAAERGFTARAPPIGRAAS